MFPENAAISTPATIAAHRRDLARLASPRRQHARLTLRARRALRG